MNIRLGWNVAFIFKAFAAAKNSSSYLWVAAGKKHFKCSSTQIGLKNIHICHNCVLKSCQCMCRELALFPCPGCHLQSSWQCEKCMHRVGACFVYLGRKVANNQLRICSHVLHKTLSHLQRFPCLKESGAHDHSSLTSFAFAMSSREAAGK